jgi:hypothetical protein
MDSEWRNQLTKTAGEPVWLESTTEVKLGALSGVEGQFAPRDPVPPVNARTDPLRLIEDVPLS